MNARETALEAFISWLGELPNPWCITDFQKTSLVRSLQRVLPSLAVVELITDIQPIYEFASPETWESHVRDYARRINVSPRLSNGMARLHEYRQMVESRYAGFECPEGPEVKARLETVQSSHLDHGLSAAHLEWVLEVFSGKTGLFKETVLLPRYLPDLKCALHGPISGTPPVHEDEAIWMSRGTRSYRSRMCKRPAISTRLVSVIGGPYKNRPCVLYTAFGGPMAEKEVNEPELLPSEKSRAASFWAEHALTFYV